MLVAEDFRQQLVKSADKLLNCWAGLVTQMPEVDNDAVRVVLAYTLVLYAPAA